MKENTPHDDLFKVTFSMPSEVEAFLKTYLPVWLASGLDYSTLKKEPDSFVGENLRQYFTDIIYSCRWKGSGEALRLAFLLEHKSYVPKNVFIQLLRYLTECYDHQHKSGEKLSLVVPVVVYHGEKEWKKRSFDSYFGLPDERLKTYLPLFDFELIDLVKMTDDLIINQSIGLYLRSTFLVFKHRGDKTFIEQFSQKIFIFVESEMNHDQKMFFLRSLLTYIFRAFRYEQAEFKSYIKKLPEMIETVAGSLYDRLIEEGMEKGLEKGMEKGLLIKDLEEKISLLARLAEKKFDLETAADISGLDMPFVRDFNQSFSKKKANALLKAIAEARQLKDMATVERHLAQQLHAFGFSLPVLGKYFKKKQKGIEKMLKPE